MHQRGKLTMVVKLTKEDHVTFKITSMVSLHQQRGYMCPAGGIDTLLGPHIHTGLTCDPAGDS